MTESKLYKIRLNAVRRKNERYQEKLSLDNERMYPKWKWPSMSKIVLASVFLMCMQLILFCEYMVAKTSDMSAMYTLIGVPATLVPTVIAYYQKSTKENTAGGIVYETAMHNDPETMG